LIAGNKEKSILKLLGTIKTWPFKGLKSILMSTSQTSVFVHFLACARVYLPKATITE